MAVLLVVPSVMISRDPPRLVAEPVGDEVWSRLIVWVATLLVFEIVLCVLENRGAKIALGPFTADVPGDGGRGDAQIADSLASVMRQFCALEGRLEGVEKRLIGDAASSRGGCPGSRRVRPEREAVSRP